MISNLLEKNLLPDSFVRFGIRRLLAQRLNEESTRYDPSAYTAALKRAPIAEETRAANAQHYEVPTEFFSHCLGRRMKYSGCFYPTGRESLDEAEEQMLALYVERARLVDGMSILELGCGWGSLTLFLAEKFPRARITAVSNSRTQKTYIDAAARERGLHNIEVITCDMNVFSTGSRQFDRVVSVEMFEHMKNYQALLARVASWLKPGGLLFVHIFTHQRYAYHFIARDETDWMARYFFTGGQMPSHDLLAGFQDDLRLIADWKVDGTHYQRTAEHWLHNMDAQRGKILPILAHTYGPHAATKWWSYWRTFFMACAELWGYRGGQEWLVSHYLFQRP